MPDVPPPPTNRPPFVPQPRTRDTVIFVIGCVIAGIAGVMYLIALGF
jgi:hypothetical protein